MWRITLLFVAATPLCRGVHTQAVLWPQYEDEKGLCQLLTNHECGPSGYLCPGGERGVGRLFEAGVKVHGREGLIKKWRGFGVRLGYLLLSQVAWKNDHFFRKIPCFRAFSLGSTQCMVRCAMHLWFYERKKKRRRGRGRRMPRERKEKAESMAVQFVELITEMGIIDPDSSGLIYAAKVACAVPFMLCCIALALDHGPSRDLMWRQSILLGYGPIICPSCFFGAYAYILLLARDIAVASLVGHAAAYAAVAAPIKLAMHIDIRWYCILASRLMKRWALEKTWSPTVSTNSHAIDATWSLSVQFMDNTIKRALSPILTVGFPSTFTIDGATLTARDVKHSPRGRLGITAAHFPYIVKTPEWKLMLVAAEVYNNAGVWDQAIVERVLRPPSGARGEHRTAADAYCRFFGTASNLIAHGAGDDLGSDDDDGDLVSVSDAPAPAASLLLPASTTPKPEPDPKPEPKPPLPPLPPPPPQPPVPPTPGPDDYWISLVYAMAARLLWMRLVPWNAPRLTKADLPGLGYIVDYKRYPYDGGRELEVICLTPYPSVAHLRENWGPTPSLGALRSTDPAVRVRLRELAVPAFDFEEYMATLEREREGWEAEA